MEFKIKTSASYIVSEEILSQTEKFTVTDIFNKVSDAIKELFESAEEIKTFISEKIYTLCQLGLVSGTGIYYYVLG